MVQTSIGSYISILLLSMHIKSKGVGIPYRFSGA